MQTKQGGLSDGVWKSRQLMDYIGEGKYVHGYIGSSSRTVWADKMVEAALRKQGLGNEGIGCWLTSGSGRHLADCIQRGHYLDFEKSVKDYTDGAFLQVAIWNHPDHQGSLASTHDLQDKLKKALDKK